MTPRETELTQQLQAREDELRQSREELDRARQKIALLEQKIDLLVRRIFGASSEQLDPGQLELLLQAPAAQEPPGKEVASLLLEEEAVPAPSKDASGRRSRGRQPRVPANLPAVETTIEPAEVQKAPEQWRRIGQEVSEQLDYEPGRFFRRVVIRPKYVSRQDLDHPPVIAPLPAKLQDRCMAGPGLLAHIVTAKFCDHLPLYRLEMIFSTRHGVYLPRQTMVNWMGLAADSLRLIYEEIKAEVFGGGYAQVDESPIDYLCPGHGETKQGYFWVCRRPLAETIYFWQTSRSADCLKKIIPVNFAGTLQCDGYAAYDCFAKGANQTITLAGCWAHVRRGFHDALESAPRDAGLILRLIQHLYRIEADLRGTRAGPPLREATRAHRSRPLHQRIHRFMEAMKKSRRHLPQSLMGKALNYALGEWPKLGVYLGDGRIEIDNNLVENAIRPTKLGLKNWLFIGEAAAGERAAVLYTIVESCRRHGLDAEHYLREVFTALPTLTNWTVKHWTPAAYAKAQRLKKAA